MIGNLEIALALKAHLQTLPSIPLLIVDGAGQELPTGVTYLTEKLMPTNKTSPTVKGTGFQIATGIYQVDVRAPTGSGKWDQTEIADNIEELFKNAVSLPTTNGSVKILNTSSSSLRASGDHQAISVTVNYITAR
jgi:hypothetical protein